MKYIKSLTLLILAVIATSCTTFSDEPSGSGTIFIPYDVVDCTITGSVIANPFAVASNSKVWSVSEMTVYRDWRVNSADGKLNLIKEEQRKVTYTPNSPCYVSLPANYQNSQIGDKVEDLPLQMIIEQGTIGDSKNLVTLGSVIKVLTEEELDKPATGTN